MHKEKKGKNFIKKPVYEGGLKALKQFIRENLKYPEEALKKKIEGSVALTYTIDYQGKVIDVKVVSGLGYGCDEEATRLVKLLKFRVPKNRGVKVQFHKNIQIHFRLPKQKPRKKTAASITYTLTESKKEKQKKPPEKKEGGYTITITY